MITVTKILAAGAVTMALALATEAAVETKQKASGTFEVKVTPGSGGEGSLASARMTVAKVFSGDLAGTSKGEMWTAGTAVEGSAGYVAIEKVEGALHGRKGAFTLIHQGTMRRGGEYQLRVVVVPDSGTGELEGLSGTMTIRIEKGAHYYDFDYSLPPRQ
jgi:hypothetical protein